MWAEEVPQPPSTDTAGCWMTTTGLPKSIRPPPMCRSRFFSAAAVTMSNMTYAVLEARSVVVDGICCAGDGGGGGGGGDCSRFGCCWWYGGVDGIGGSGSCCCWLGVVSPLTRPRSLGTPETAAAAIIICLPQ